MSKEAEQSDSSLQALPPPSLIRDTSRVAEPEVAYDSESAEARLWRQPLLWLRRNMELFFPLAGFVLRVAQDLQQGKEEERRPQRARECQEIIASLGPAIIKGGQALASRPDLLPKEYLVELQRLRKSHPRTLVMSPCAHTFNQMTRN